MRDHLDESELLLDKYMQLPDIARDYIRSCTSPGDQREAIIRELFNDFKEYYYQDPENK